MRSNQLSITAQQLIESERLIRIKNIPCLIMWGTEDNLIPIEYADKFTQVLQHAEFEKIDDAGH